MSAALLICTTMPAQSIKDNDVTFVYVRLPKEPLGKSYTNYQGKVEMSYVAENAAKKAEYDQKLANVEVQYQKDMEDWKVRDAQAQAQYDKDMAEYNKKGTAEKIADKKLLNEGKPVRQTPPQPYRNNPPVPVYKKEYDPNLLASSYIKLEGFNNQPDNAVTITVTLYGFDCIKPVMKTEVKKMTRIVNGTSTPYNQTYYHYETSYKHPMSVKVEVPGKGIVLNQTIEAFNQYTVIKTNETDNSAAQNMDVEAYVRNLEEKVLMENLKFINELVNEKYGFSKVSRTSVLNNVESKKMNYDDYQGAYDNAKAGYDLLATDKDAAAAKLNLAIQAWEKALTESNPSDKKARVDADVTMATRFNLLEAYVFAGDFANAEAQLQKINSSDPSKKQKKRAEELDLFIKDMKARTAANS